MHKLREDLQAGRVPQLDSPVVDKKRKGEGLDGSLSRLEIPREERRKTHQRNEDRYFIADEFAQARWRRDVATVKIANISSNGIMIETDRPADIGEKIAVRLDDCDPITCGVRWVKDARIGLEFLEETGILAEAGVVEYVMDNIQEALGAAGELSDRRLGVERRGREMRHGLVWLGEFATSAWTCKARLRNISRTGAMITIEEDHELCSGQEGLLNLGAAGHANGRVRWIAGETFGFRFDEEFDVARLCEQRAADVAVFTPREDDERDDEDPDAFEAAGHYRREKPEVDPHSPPDMEYKRLTMDEIYQTLYPDGRPEAVDSPPEAQSPQPPQPRAKRRADGEAVVWPEDEEGQPEAPAKGWTPPQRPLGSADWGDADDGDDVGTAAASPDWVGSRQPGKEDWGK